MQGKLLALGLLAFAQGALAADAGEFSLGVGFNYSTGEYGTSATTEILSIPVIARYDRVTYFGGIGYTELGSSPYIQLNSVLNATAGASYKLDERNSAGLSVDTRERASPSGSPQRELTAFWTQKIDGSWKAQAYVLKGFANGSPDWGVGASVAHAF